MSTAIMQQTSVYEFGDYFLKNQVCSSSASSEHHLALSRARSLDTTATPSKIRQALDQAVAAHRLQQQQQHRRLERAASEPAPPPPPPPNASRYKTELCRPFEEAGACKYGDKCQFAHGMRELRNLQRHPKYKTELCRTFHSVGFCPYGPRCHFVHNADEVRASRPSLPPSPSSRSPADSIVSVASIASAGSVASAGSFYPPSPPSSPSVSPEPSSPADEARLPVFSTLMSMRDLAIA